MDIRKKSCERVIREGQAQRTITNQEKGMFRIENIPFLSIMTF